MTATHPRMIAIALASLSIGGLFGMIIAAQPATASAPKHQQPPAPAAAKHEADDDNDDEGGESTIKLADAPAPVQAAITRLLAGNSVKELSKESDDNITTYEVVWEADGQSRSADLSAAGDVLALESAIEADALPTTLTDLIAHHHPDATIEAAELVQETYYEIVLKIDGKSHEFKVNAAGELQGGEDGGDAGGEAKGNDKDKD